MAGNDDGMEEKDKVEDYELRPEQARQHRAVAATLNYLAFGRIDIQYAVEEAARAMSCPRSSQW